MSIVTAVSGEFRAVGPRQPGAPPIPQTSPACQSIGHGASGNLLGFGIVALALGLAVVMASLVPLTDHLGKSIQYRRHIALSRAVDPGRLLLGVAHNQALLLTAPAHSSGMSFPALVPHVSATGPWNSPLYPQNGVTLWDRIRVSSKRDREAFLLGTAIQLHAPETAATPGPRVELPASSIHSGTTSGTLSCEELVLSPSLAMAACAAPTISGGRHDDDARVGAVVGIKNPTPPCGNVANPCGDRYNTSRRK